MKLVLEYDDFHWMDPENCLDTVDKFVGRYPEIKLSFFSIPHLRGFPMNSGSGWCEEVREHIGNGNVQLARHGFYHTQEEFKHYNYDQAITSLVMGDDVVKDAGLSEAKVFRAPHWGLCEGAIKALVDMEYTHLYNHEDYIDMAEPFKNQIKVMYYNWNLADDEPEKDTGISRLINKLAPKTIIAHGHTHDVCGNGISQTFDKVCDFIENNSVEFRFVNEV